MEKFFMQILFDLDKLSGIKQYKKFLDDPNGRTEIANLVKILCRVSRQYPDVPPDAQKRAINDAIVQDDDFIGLNAKFVNRALNRARERMAQNTPKVDISDPAQNPNILTGEARQEWLRKWEAQVKALGDTTTPDYSKEQERRRINERRKAWGFPEID